MPKKSLGQHWLKDMAVLETIAGYAMIQPSDTILEIGPGLGTLTRILLARAQRVIAVEYDRQLAVALTDKLSDTRLEVIHDDILHTSLDTMPYGYKVVANIPYYITSKIITRLLGTTPQPEVIVLLVQKEVAEKYTAQAGAYTANTLFFQNTYDVQLGIRVSKMYFTPPPTTDSQVLICTKRNVPIIAEKDLSAFYRLVRIGFSSPRKKLASNMRVGLGMTKEQAETILQQAGIDPYSRAHMLSIDDWKRLI